MISRPVPMDFDRLADPGLETLAQSLSVSLPGTDPVSLTLLGVLAAGRPVTRRELAAALGGAEAEAEAMVSAAVARMPNLEVDAEGRIVGCGLTLSPTEHQIVFTGPPLYTWCAFDTVLFPVLLRWSAGVWSHCHATGVPVRYAIGPHGPEDVAPPAAVISLVVPEQANLCCDLRGSFCRDVHFFASPTAAATWRAAHETGHIVSIAEAYAVARRIGALCGAGGGMSSAMS